MAAPETTSPAWDERLLQNPHAVADKRARVRRMFAAIAPSYDLNNRLHSLWMDQSWRRKAVKLANLKSSDRVVDVACGTGDLTLAFALQLWINLGATQLTNRPEAQKFGQVVGLDFTHEMLPLARSKARAFISRKSVRGALRYRTRGTFSWTRFDGTGGDLEYPKRDPEPVWINADAQALPLSDASADVVSIAFGIRNVADPLAAMREFHRVLRPSGRLIILEFSLPTNPLLRGLYNFYFRQVLPRTATLISGDKTGAYKYLPESVNTFIGRQEMTRMMAAAGFEQVEQFPLTFGVCVCYRGVRV